MTPVPRLFLDASIWIAASGSTTGASALILSLCRHGTAKAVTSRLVLLESERNIQAKLGDDALAGFYGLIADLPMEVLGVPAPEEIRIHEKAIHQKDAHVLASATKGEVDHLLTLDRKHFFAPSVRGANLPFTVLTPGDFLRKLVA